MSEQSPNPGTEVTTLSPGELHGRTVRDPPDRTQVGAATAASATSRTST